MSKHRHMWVLMDNGTLHCHCGDTVKDVATYAIDGEKCITKLKQQLADLRANLEAAEKEISELEEELSATKTLLLSEGVNKKLIAQDRDNLQAKLNRDTKLLEKCINDQKETIIGCQKVYTDLQAAYDVVRGALKRIGMLCVSPESDSNKVKIIMEYQHKALSITPTEAGERVRGLVDALEYYADKDQFRSVPSMITDNGKIARDALAKYRGGAE